MHFRIHIAQGRENTMSKEKALRGVNTRNYKDALGQCVIIPSIHFFSSPYNLPQINNQV